MGIGAVSLALMSLWMRILTAVAVVAGVLAPGCSLWCTDSGAGAGKGSPIRRGCDSSS